SYRIGPFAWIGHDCSRANVARSDGLLACLVGRDSAQPAGLVVRERLDDLLAGVHHERAVLHDGLADRLPAHDVQVERRGAAVLRTVGTQTDRVPGAQDGELARAD